MTKKVLVVEDDQAVRNVLKHILESSHHEVMLSSGVKDGLRQAPEADLILLDLKLGAETGDTFLEHLRASGQYTPVIVLSASVPKAEGEIRLKKYKIVEFVEKPFKAGDLLGKIDMSMRMSDTMKSTVEAVDQFSRATNRLRVLAGKSITEIGNRSIV